MITVSETVEIRSPAEAVFAHVDDIRNLGWHMTSRSSMAIMGSRRSLRPSLILVVCCPRIPLGSICLPLRPRRRPHRFGFVSRCGRG